METITYTNASGDSVTLSYTSDDTILDKYDGFGPAEIVPETTQGYGQHGQTLRDVKYGARIMQLYFNGFAPTPTESYALRRRLASVFNPLRAPGVLVYENDHIRLSVPCAPTVAPTPVERNGLLTYYNIELTAYDPFWRDVAESGIKLSGYKGGLTFPFNFGAPVQFASIGDIAKINIVGDVESPIRAEFRGAAVNPRLTLVETGEYIEVAATLTEGQTLVITTDYGNKKVTIDGVSATHLINPASTFFSLRPGDNTLSYTSETVLGSPEVYVFWRNRYVGV